MTAFADLVNVRNNGTPAVTALRFALEARVLGLRPYTVRPTRTRLP